jgi:hypothetical protein
MIAELLVAGVTRRRAYTARCTLRAYRSAYTASPNTTAGRLLHASTTTSCGINQNDVRPALSRRVRTWSVAAAGAEDVVDRRRETHSGLRTDLRGTPLSVSWGC